MKTTPKSAIPEQIPRAWHWHFRALHALRDTLADERDARTAALREPQREGGTDAGDDATARQERDELLVEISVEDAELTEVEAALGRMRDGTYGVCTVTGKPISPERLRAVPWTRFSVEAAVSREGGHVRGAL